MGESRYKQGVLCNKPDLENVKKIILAFKNHPALLGWYLGDTPPVKYTEELKKDLKMHKFVYDLVKELDPHHIAWSCIHGQVSGMFPEYLEITDVVSTDHYPISADLSTRVSKWTDEASLLAEGKKPVWIVPQAFGAQEHWFGEPTPDELRCMTYLAITHGAKGIFYFCYKPLYQRFWKEIGKLAKEIKKITPVLLSPTHKRGVLVNSRLIHTLLKEYNGKRYLIAVNSARKKIDAAFTFNPKWGSKVKVLFENRKINCSIRGHLKDIFVGYDVHIYEIVK